MIGAKANATGGSLTALMVIDTVAGLLVSTSSSAMNVKSSAPLKSGFGVYVPQLNLVQ